ncbi:MarR family winged helix-turn-helix transcriptional regulator [Chitinophaga rhizophila]|uniref:DNA-binding transcriptional regulator, MarR family n=1 Tax=Chitinophaga rhizophila TaxID=2866212 RepID=A0ABS7GFK0_9BACT|nr:hypothetical protein [Chitinophaga rhizophila]MBW8686464.1 hypothetical protein [Chitinophaga rhizophila]
MEMDKPLGWYLKEADKRITAFLDDELNDLAVSRYHWRVMCAIAAQGSINTWQFYQELKAFIGVQQYGELLQSLTERGWVTVSVEDKCVFTASGKEAYENMRMLQKERTARMMQGITEEEYNLAVSVLNRIIENTGQHPV